MLDREKIRNKAKGLGFFTIGICKPEVLREGEYLKEWLKRGFHAGMKWMETSLKKRIDTFKVYPEAKSIIVCAIDYYNDQKNINNEWQISRYALGLDYHAVVKNKLKELLEFIKLEDENVKGKVFVDTGPIIEKVWAQKAGIGWIGKNTCLITPEKGTWVFLGEILINAELEYDIPEQSKCGDCNLCLKACPAGALVEPYVLNSNLCISYLTIEHKGVISEYLSKKIGNKIFGCDACQEICPWNKREKNTSVREFLPHSNIFGYSLEDLLRMDKKTFHALFENSAVKRAGFEGFKRNLRLVQENLRNK